VAVVDKRDERVMAEGLLPGRGGVLLLGVGEHQHTVNVHDHVAAGSRAPCSGQVPDPRAHLRTCAPDHGQGLRTGRGESIEERETVGSEAAGPNTPKLLPEKGRQCG
jgi:hypothetical protein